MGNYFKFFHYYWKLRIKFIFIIVNFPIEKNSVTNYDFRNTKNRQVFYYYQFVEKQLLIKMKLQILF